MFNVPRSPAVDRVMAVHNGLAHLVEVYGKQLTELSAENHAVRAEIMAQKQAHEVALKAKDEIILQYQQRVAELEKQVTALEKSVTDLSQKVIAQDNTMASEELKALASFDQCG